MGNLSKNFSDFEFASPDGKDPDAIMSLAFIKKLQNLRTAFQFPMIITSGIRSASHNRKVQGVSTSRHLERPCIAADIDTSNWRPAKLKKFVRLIFEHKFHGIGMGKNFIHLDGRNIQQAAIWFH